MTARPPLLWLIIGPNGAGKSTYHATRVEPRLLAEFVNANRIALERWPDAGPEKSYEAARIAAERRSELLGAGRSLVAETVASHPSKLELLHAAQASGYEVWVSFVCLESAALAVERVARRVRHGGHPVPEEKVRARYERMAPIAQAAVASADRAFVVDNSETKRPLRDVMLVERGHAIWRAPDPPAWLGELFPE
ncbi:MAG TPA: AAA family ATPase [Myxococcota bacterium]|nr:AAA family ATPase [Myxococcota bacterium]